MSASSSYRATLGWIKPGAIDLKIQRFFEMLPPVLNVSILTTMWSLQMTSHDEFDTKAFAARRDDILQAVRDLLEYQSIDVLAVTGDLIQAAMGVSWDREFRDALASASNRPAVTGMTAVADALHDLGARSVAIASPYPEKKTGYLRAYLEEAGFEIVGTVSHPTRSGKDLRALPESAPYDAARQVLTSAPEAQALYLPSPSWLSNQYVEQIEREFDRPVVTMMNSVLWAAESALGWTDPKQGFGRLLASVGRERTPSQTHHSAMICELSGTGSIRLQTARSLYRFV